MARCDLKLRQAITGGNPMNRKLLILAAASLLFAGPALSQSQQNQTQSQQPAAKQAKHPSASQNPKAVSTGQGQEAKSAKSSKQRSVRSGKSNRTAAKGRGHRMSAKGHSHRMAAKERAHRMARHHRATEPTTTGAGWNWGNQQQNWNSNKQQSWNWQQPFTGPCKKHRRPDGSSC